MKTTVKALALSVQMDELSKHIDPNAFKELALWIAQFGSPLTHLLEEGGDLRVFKFKQGVTVTFFDWGGMDASTVYKDLQISELLLNNEIVSTYLEGTTLHSFYAQAVNFHEAFNKQSAIFGNFDLWHYGKPLINPRMPIKERFVSMTYIDKRYGVSVVKKSK